MASAVDKNPATGVQTGTQRREAPPRATSASDPPAVFVGRDPKVLELFELVYQVAATDATILITGESGTGKEVIARTLHQNSARKQAAFIAVNCGAITATLHESELFGHARGAFTGATEAKIGKFEAADGGTIFLDEIAEMDRALQAKLLRILQYGEYAPVGVATNCYCDVRVVAASNQDLRPLLETGKFRKDLYYRLNIIRLDLPSLRDRRSDIPLLIDHFLRRFSAAYHKEGLQVSPEAQDILQRYDYPGNVRELENLMRRAVILCRGQVIVPAHLTPEVLVGCRTPAPNLTAGFHQAKAQAVGEFEQAYLVTILAECGGIVSRAAQRAGLSERNFHEKLKKYGIRGKDFRAGPTANGKHGPTASG